jgi:hypothetical protein
MVDYFALALSHGLLVLAAWQLLQRDDLDVDPQATDEDPPKAPEVAAKPGLRSRA